MEEQSLLLAHQVAKTFGLAMFALSSGLFVHAMRNRERSLTMFRLALGAMALGTVASGWLVLQKGLSTGWNQIAGQLLPTMLGLMTLLSFVRLKIHPIGAFTAPLATLILLFHLFATPIPSVSSGGSGLIYAHIVTAILGQTFAIGACGVSVLFLWQRNALKKRQLDLLPAEVPAMDRLDKLLMIFVWSGFAFLTFSLVSGAVYVNVFQFPIASSLQAKIVWAIAVWIWYLAILLARNVMNQSGRRVAQMSLGGFLLLAVSYFGMAFFRNFGG